MLSKSDLLTIMMILIFVLLLILRYHNIKWERNKPDCFGCLWGPVDYAENDCCTCQYCGECHRLQDKGRNCR